MPLSRRLLRRLRVTGAIVCLTLTGWMVLLDELLAELFPRMRS